MYRLGVPSVILRDRDVPPGEEDPTGGFPGAKGDPRRTGDRTGERERRGRAAEGGIPGRFQGALGDSFLILRDQAKAEGN
jgi:hypothetical protein